MKSLEKKIGKLYPGLPWSKSIGMRVMIAHVYHKVEPEVVYLTATRDIPLLKDQILAVKNELDSMENN